MSRPKGKTYTVYVGREEVFRTLAQSDKEAIDTFAGTLDETLDEFAADKGCTIDDVRAVVEGGRRNAS